MQLRPSAASPRPHLAQGRGDCAETMRTLLRAAPDSWAAADHRGCLPVHLAAGNGGSEESVAVLLRAAEAKTDCAVGSSQKLQPWAFAGCSLAPLASSPDKVAGCRLCTSAGASD